MFTAFMKFYKMQTGKKLIVDSVKTRDSKGIIYIDAKYKNAPFICKANKVECVLVGNEYRLRGEVNDIDYVYNPTYMDFRYRMIPYFHDTTGGGRNYSSNLSSRRISRSVSESNLSLYGIGSQGI